MALIATTLIVRGKMTFSEVPTTLKDQVRQMLNDIDMDQLIKEQAE
ncbi:CD1375 family protein [Aneurinibacillus aneurinilyticus]